jgi:hypothetical protein
VVDVGRVVQQVAHEVAADLIAHQPQTFLEAGSLVLPCDLEVVDGGVTPSPNLTGRPLVGIGDVEALGIEIVSDSDHVGHGVGHRPGRRRGHGDLERIAVQPATRRHEAPTQPAGGRSHS